MGDFASAVAAESTFAIVVTREQRLVGDGRKDVALLAGLADEEISLSGDRDDEIGTTLDVWRPVGSLTIAQQQMVQIAMAVSGGAGIIIFDEPTSSLSQVEADRLYELIGRLKERGVACIYVSHRMPEVFRLCDTVSVLRDGQHVGTRPIAGLSEHDLVQMMIGRPLAEYVPRREGVIIGDELLRVEACHPPESSRTSRSRPGGRGVSIAGLVGAGRSSWRRHCSVWTRASPAGFSFGVRPCAWRRRRGDCVRHRAGAGGRKRQGLVPQESGVHNLSLAILRRLARFSWLRQREERNVAREFFDRLRVQAPSIDTVVAACRRNQQKIVLARWLAAKSGVLILDEPTRGVDVGAKAEIHGLIGELANQGAAILLISSELPEVLTLSQRILVLRAGRIVGEVTQAQATQDGLLRMMAGLGASPSLLATGT
jgi:ABC-type sugar transport system ATPase subunit